MTGAEVERELRKQEDERAKRKGPSTAMLEAEVWFYIVQHHPDMSARAIVKIYSAEIEAMTGIAAQGRQRDLVSAAKKSLRVHLGAWGGFGDEADIQFAKALTEAQAEYAKHKRALSQQGKAGGGAGRTDETKLGLTLRDALVIENANGATAKYRLESANAALIEAGFKPISLRTLFRIQEKSRDRAF